ncbi:hypothetical protein [Neorhizobium alkalisoli]|jgi:hypothetical protein|uniref:Uncharacterized protein n=1 Tax=Neorhizobium alkalisoli TaxID=528178 RepID=A0A561QW84_9HYPH|nr:hypothetical protein [Neorhizobium alkalisoli]TWF54586.1 hypothetical protein FHW37_103456 [Neorhizobium alkalisoli]
MSASPLPGTPEKIATPRPINTPEMIDRLANELRVKSGGELPHAFCVEQVKKQLAGKATETAAANDETAHQKPQDQKASVFHSWAISE